MADKGFYMFNLERSYKKLAILLIAVIVIVIAFMLFSIWPLWLKIGIWYVSFYLLVVMVGFILFRALVWFIFFLFGADFWIFPNFFNDTVDFLDSFRPFI
jgi:translocation protein SEC62